jgi:hypothetical protein
MKFEKGNPGKPKDAQNKLPQRIREMCQKVAPQAVNELERLINDPNPSVRASACKEILDRAIGKAAQPVVGADEGPVQVKHVVSWIRDDKPEALVSKEQLSGCAGHTEDLAWH